MAPVEARVTAADLAGQLLALGIWTLAPALGHTYWPKPVPNFLLMEELKKLRLKALLSLAVIPSEVFWTDAVWASWHIHTGPPLLAGVVFAAVVFHFLGLQAVCPLLVLLKVGGGSTPGQGATPAPSDAFVVQLPVILEGEVAGPPSDGEHYCVLICSVLMLPGGFPRWSQKR